MYALQGDALEKWVQNQEKRVTNEGFIKVSHKISDPDMQAGVASQDALFLSNLPQRPDLLLGENPSLVNELNVDVVPYGTLERNYWRLDGKRATLPDAPGEEDYGYCGYISSSLSRADKTFKTPPVLVIEVCGENGQPVPSLPGLIITWGMVGEDEYPTRFRVKVFGPGSAVPLNDPKPIENGSVISEVAISGMKDFTRIEIEILAWNHADRRARISKVFLGHYREYEKGQLLDFTFSQSIDPMANSLPKYEISFSVDNRNRAFNPFDPDGYSKYMMQRQEIRTKYGYRIWPHDPQEPDDSVEWIDGGVYYLSDWSAAQHGVSASFRARDLLELLSAEYNKGVFPPHEETTNPIHELSVRCDGLYDGRDIWHLDPATLNNAPMQKLDLLTFDKYEFPKTLAFAPRESHRWPSPWHEKAFYISLVELKRGDKILYDGTQEMPPRIQSKYDWYDENYQPVVLKAPDRSEHIPGFGLIWTIDKDYPHSAATSQVDIAALCETVEAREGPFKATILITDFHPMKQKRETLYDLAEKILKSANLPRHSNGNPRWELHKQLSWFYADVPLPVKQSIADCLKMIAHAACCTMFFDRQGTLHIAPLEAGDRSSGLEITRDNSYSHVEIDLSKPVGCINVNRQVYVDAGEKKPGDDNKKLYEETIDIDPGVSIKEIFYTRPTKAKSVAVQVDNDPENKITTISKDCYAQYCRLTFRSGYTERRTCKIRIEGADVADVLERTDASVKVMVSGSSKDEELPVTNPLISVEGHAENVGRWLKAHVSRRRHTSVDWRQDPRLDAGDIITNGHEKGTANKIQVTSSGFSFTGAFKGKTEGVELE